MGVFRATVDLAYAAGSGRGVNTWTLRTSGGPLDNDTIENLMGYVNQFYSALAFAFPTDSTFRWSGEVQELGTAEPAFRPALTPWTVVGSNAAGSYGPAPAMICVTWRTALANRSGRGRTFLGPVSAGVFQGNGTIVDSSLTAIRTAAADLVDESDTDLEGGALAVWSEKDQVARDFVGSSVTDQVAVLRSRR